MDRTEAQTRREIIDKNLRKAGWEASDPSQVSLEFNIYLGDSGVEEEFKTEYTDHQFVDYLLLGKDGKPLAVVEAKRTSKDARVGKEQSLQYAKNIENKLVIDRPFVFYTNGYEAFFWDTENYPPRKIYGFPTRDDLERLRFLRKERSPLSVELISKDIAARPYQIQAIRTVLEGVENNKRKFLLVMATGTGKTRMCVSLIDVLTRAKWGQRVLFLVDRIALGEQAYEAFKDFLPNAPIWPERGEKEFSFDRRIYVSTYPTMMNIIENEDKYISPFFFDVIVADESHRSIYNVYKNILNYFDAFQVGLTATPTNKIEHDTFELFESKSGDPTFAYSYEEATQHIPPYLNDFEVLDVQSKFQLEGIKADNLPYEIQGKLIEEGKELDDINFEGTDLEHKVTNSGTNKVIVQEFMEESIKDGNGVLPGKSIFFAVSKNHARRLEEIFDALYPEHKGSLAKVIVSEDSRSYGKGGLLDQFKNQDFPRIAISVDMLDTGIDIREVVNLVFAKPVYSYTKFWQMIGRGTRVLEENPAKRKEWCTQKDKFLIIDCWSNFQYFKMNPKGREPGSQTPLPVRLFHARLNKLEASLKTNRNEIVERVINDIRADINSLPENNVVVLENKAVLERANDDNFWNGITDEKLDFLRKTIAPILRARHGMDFKAMRFEIDITDLSTSHILANNEVQNILRESIIGQVNELPLTINLVHKEKDLIEEIQKDEYWSSIEEDKLYEAIKRLAPLMRFRDPVKNEIEKLNLEDLVTKKEWVEFGREHERMTTFAYRARVEKLINELKEKNTVLQKLLNGEQITKNETIELENLLQEQNPNITVDLLQKVYDNQSATFIQFIRHILGLERLSTWPEEVTLKFDRFIAEHSDYYTSRQIQFLQMLKTTILQKRDIEKSDLVELPFTRLHSQGIRGLFNNAEIAEIYSFSQQFNQA
ncbi:DEAD/DEAH box helicase family protein [Patescibacteria group bacterium]|nr:DEAD/DEAH box helicase family protein [Patescibacteria group bacterium]MBU4016039.1 DEAD/DEAH box helicase family protein [Patescibacteria group bacterium]MBU4099192.1 DEAD/DEAH box helicase family protein [Patescibacteria group bacterium]